MNNKNRLSNQPRQKQSLSRKLTGAGLLLSIILVGIFVQKQSFNESSTKESSQEMAQQSLQEESTLSQVKKEAENAQEQTVTNSESLEENQSASASSMVSKVSWASASFALEARSGKISWTTQVEQNTDHFEVLKSVDDQNFISIGKVSAAGEGIHHLQEYSLSDQSLAWNEMPRTFYKVKSVGKDGNISMSDVIEYDFDLDLGMYLQVSEKSGEELSMLYVADRNMSCEFEILNMNGELITQSELEVGTTPGTLLLDISELNEGVYFFRLKNSTNSITEIVHIN